jgi:hypothetical protein
MARNRQRKPDEWNAMSSQRTGLDNALEVGNIIISQDKNTSDCSGIPFNSMARMIVELESKCELKTKKQV